MKTCFSFWAPNGWRILAWGIPIQVENLSLLTMCKILMLTYFFIQTGIKYPAHAKTTYPR